MPYDFIIILVLCSPIFFHECKYICIFFFYDAYILIAIIHQYLRYIFFSIKLSLSIHCSVNSLHSNSLHLILLAFTYEQLCHSSFSNFMTFSYVNYLRLPFKHHSSMDKAQREVKKKISESYLVQCKTLNDHGNEQLYLMHLTARCVYTL